MNRFQFCDVCGNVWTRCTKKHARTVYNRGEKVIICPVDMRPFGPWGYGCMIDNSDGGSFAKAINAFEFYNCRTETGRYAAYYVQTETAEERREAPFAVGLEEPWRAAA